MIMLGCSLGTQEIGLVIGLVVLMACYLGLYGILSGLTKSTDHPSGTSAWSSVAFTLNSSA